MHSWFALGVMATTHLGQFGVTSYILINTMSCPQTAAGLFITGFLSVPIVLIVNGLWSYKGTLLAFKLLTTLLVLTIYPAVTMYFTVVSQLSCPEVHTMLWILHGMSLPVVVWTFYKLLRYDQDKGTDIVVEPVGVEPPV